MLILRTMLTWVPTRMKKGNPDKKVFCLDSFCPHSAYHDPDHDAPDAKDDDNDNDTADHDDDDNDDDHDDHHDDADDADVDDPLECADKNAKKDFGLCSE